MDAPHDEPLLLPFEDAGTRRGFLQLVGFGIAGAALSSCSRGPVRYVVPALAPSPEVVPGRAYWIATTCSGCEAGCGVLAKCRDGRPIKLEGNPQQPIGSGGLCAAGQASVLSLYDSRRLDGPRKGGSDATWGSADTELKAAFDALRSGGGRVRVLTRTVHGPSTRAAVSGFLAGFADGRHVAYDALSASALLDAHELAFGRRVLPRHLFQRARVIASFDADFLATWISPVEFTAGYTAARSAEGAEPRMSKHFQLEARTSLTGCRADERARLAPWEQVAALRGLCALLEQRAGGERRLAGAADSAPRRELLERIAAELWKARGASLVVAGANDLAVQVLAGYANELLGNYGTTLDLERPSHQRMGDDRALAVLRDELEAGRVDALIVQGVNPAYDLAGRLPIERAKLLISCAASADETSGRAHWTCPEPHALEAWDDAEPWAGTFALRQPTVPSLRNGRTLRASLARWSGDGRSDRDLLREHWRAEIFPRVPRASGLGFDAFFDQALHDGFVEAPAATAAAGRAPAFRPAALASATAESAAPAGGALALVLYPKVGMLDGRHAHNPWLHELPDPVTKITWDNYACLSPATAEGLGVADGDVVRVEAPEGSGQALELPVHVQVGQHDGVVAVALGYGRAGTDRFANVGPEWIGGHPTVDAGGTIGASAGAFIGLDGGPRAFAGRAVTVARTNARRELAATQDHHSLTVPAHLAPEGHEVRDAVLSTSLADWLADPAGLVPHHDMHAELWPDDHAKKVRWGLSIDLARCTGCSACVVACQAENNVPVVGRDEVRRHREMSWLRIDRYYHGEGDGVGAVHQPMMCQQCDHAPCESVCPVLATVHSAEGLNQQVYNRCVGTRYCANTCPYKVRRFNWFNYQREDRLENHALNPDVTVRSRGVMEKCSFCVQRIQEAKAEARRLGRPVADGDIETACQQSCPASAIVFGDLRDGDSRAAHLAASPRAYGVLEELNVQPSVRYLAHVHNGPRESARHSGPPRTAGSPRPDGAAPEAQH